MESQLSIVELGMNMALLGAARVEKRQFGELVRTARERAGLKAFELADRMHTHGSFISRLETGAFKETPAPDIIAQLQEHLGLSQRELLTALGYLGDEQVRPTGVRGGVIGNEIAAKVLAVDWDAAPPEISRRFAALVDSVVGTFAETEKLTSEARQAREPAQSSSARGS
jgi:transcriptional regulator with XRE-family HTH domain